MLFYAAHRSVCLAVWTAGLRGESLLDSNLWIARHMMKKMSRGELPLVLPARVCHLWWARPADAHPWLLDILSLEERSRYVKLKRSDDRQRFLVACGVTRLASSRYLSRPPGALSISRLCTQCGRPHGKPQLGGAGAALDISVSHSGERIVVAFARDMRLGVDVERIEPELCVGDIAGVALNDSESCHLTNWDGIWGVRQMLTYWTRKESILKAIGLGLTVAPNSFTVSAPDEPPTVVLWPYDKSLIHGIVIEQLDPGPDYIAHLSMIGDCSCIHHLDGSRLIALSS